MISNRGEEQKMIPSGGAKKGWMDRKDYYGDTGGKASRKPTSFSRATLNQDLKKLT